jgi:hypothetical protein
VSIQQLGSDSDSSDALSAEITAGIQRCRSITQEYRAALVPELELPAAQDEELQARPNTNNRRRA